MEDAHHRLCRRKIVGWDHNAPDPFPGFGGMVGLGQDAAEQHAPSEHPASDKLDVDAL